MINSWCRGDTNSHPTVGTICGEDVMVSVLQYQVISGCASASAADTLRVAEIGKVAIVVQGLYSAQGGYTLVVSSR